VASNYPGSLDSFDTIASDKKTSDSVGGRTHRQMHNDLGDAIESVQTELGTNPSGSDATVAARLSAIEAGTNLATGAVTSAKIADGTIVNDDINASAAIARSKISGLPTSSTDNTVARFDSTAGAIQTSGVVIDDNNRLTVATGATGGYGFASGASHLSGTGAPEGVVTAAPGSTWLQTDSTTDVKGWIRWVKATGTGNTGWVAGAEADTGRRNVAALMTANATDTVGYVYMRRIGNAVRLSMQIANSVVNTSHELFASIPVGFRSMNPFATGVGWRDYLSTFTDGPAGFTSNGGQAWYAVPNGSYYYFEATWVTADAWPSSLPGSAA
jgi:hypothetical protein